MSLALRTIEARKVLNISQSELARRIGVTPQTIQAIESGKTLRPVIFTELAQTLGVEAEWLRTGSGSAGFRGANLVPIIGTAEAGVFREAVTQTVGETVLDEPDERYFGMDRFALTVRGPSMNIKIPDGSIVICVSYIELGRNPRIGEYVVVNRSVGNGLTEATIKEYGIHKGVPALIPRSTDPMFSEPLIIDNNGEDVLVTARVVRIITDI